MLKAIIGYMIGSMSGVALMCMLQINRVNKWEEMNDYESRDNEEEKKICSGASEKISGRDYKTARERSKTG